MLRGGAGYARCVAALAQVQTSARLAGTLKGTLMGLFTIVMIALVIAWVYLAILMAYDMGKRQGCKNCAPDVERADRYRDAVDSLDKWCGHESPQARLIAAHLLAVGEGLAMNAGTPCSCEPCTISGLREQLRRVTPAAEVS